MNTVVLVVYAGLVAVASLRPGGNSSLDLWDKALHFITYAVFAILAYRAVGRDRYATACLGIVAYGGLMEVLQSRMPGRTMSGLDFLANTLGVVVAAVAVRYLFRDRGRGENRGGGANGIQ